MRSVLRKSALFALMVMLSGAIQITAQQTDVAGETGCPGWLETEDPAAYGDTFPWEDSTAVDLIAFLETQHGFYTVWGCHDYWVKEEDLPHLMQLLDSEKPCANVMSSWSSFVDFEESTVGNEAAYLVLAFRVGHYPPGLNSTRPSPDKEAIRRWWRERMANGSQ